MRNIVRVAGVVGAITAAAAVSGCPVAAADSYAGKTYADASSEISGYGMTAVVAGRVGSQLPTDKCIVTRSQKAPWLKGDNFQQVTNTMLLFLNCNDPVASAGRSGNSAASPEGHQAIKDQEAYVWKSTTEEGAQWCAENQKAHPDWNASAWDGCPGT